MGRLEESTEPVGRETVNKDSHFQESLCQDSLVKEKGSQDYGIVIFSESKTFTKQI